MSITEAIEQLQSLDFNGNLSTIAKMKSSQGIVQHVRFTKYPEHTCIIKCSIYPNSNVLHEHVVMKDLQRTIGKEIPNFLTPLGEYHGFLDIKEFQRDRNNFCKYVKSSDYMIEGAYVGEFRPHIPIHVIFLPYYKNVSFGKFVSSTIKHNTHDVRLSLVKQVLCSIRLAQERCKFVHYDLHTSNIRVVAVEDNRKSIAYNFDEYTYVVDTNGFIALIIDYGFSHSVSINNCSTNCNLQFTNYSYIPNRFYPFIDYVRFVKEITVIPKFFPRSINRHLKRVVKKIPFNSHSHWIKTNSSMSYTEVVSYLYGSFHYEECDSIFSKQRDRCFEIIISLVCPPFIYIPVDNVREVYKKFLETWVKIEAYASNDYFAIITLKYLVEVVKSKRTLIMQSDGEEQVQVLCGECVDAFYMLNKTIADYTVEITKEEMSTLVIHLLLLSRHIETFLFLCDKNLNMHIRELGLESISFDTILPILES